MLIRHCCVDIVVVCSHQSKKLSWIQPSCWVLIWRKKIEDISIICIPSTAKNHRENAIPINLSGIFATKSTFTLSHKFIWRKIFVWHIQYGKDLQKIVTIVRESIVSVDECVVRRENDVVYSAFASWARLSVHSLICVYECAHKKESSSSFTARTLSFRIISRRMNVCLLYCSVQNR